MSMPSLLAKVLYPITGYTHWLHTRWPAGTVERLPETGPDGQTRSRAIRIVGDLGGVPLLKFSADSGARAVQAILREPDFAGQRDGGKNGKMLDLAIIGAGISGISAALEARKAGLSFQVFEAAEPFSTIVNFPKAKPIYTYPTDMKPAGQMHFESDVKEGLLEELQRQRKEAGIEVTPARADCVEPQGGEVLVRFTDGQPDVRARRAIIAIGRSGNFRMLDVPGEELDKVSNRLFDPKEFTGQNVLVVGGGDSALETAIALGMAGAHVILSYRKKEFSRPKPDNIDKLRALERDPSARVQVESPRSERINSAATSSTLGNPAEHPPGSVTLALGSQIVRIEPQSVTLKDTDGAERTLPNDHVFTMIGRDAPLDFFRRSRLPIRGEWTPARVLACAAFVVFCFLFYHWKKNDPTPEFTIGGKTLHQMTEERRLFPFNMPDVLERSGGALAEWSRHEGNLLYTLKRAIGDPSWYYGLMYSVIVLVFGLRRIRRRRTPYVTRQTIVLMAIQIIPLCILSDIVLPWVGRNGWFEQGSPLRWIADQLFESYDGALGHERAYWRVCGFILAWPLFVYNVFTDHPSWMWLGISLVQTFVLIPWMVWRWGKGAYCGWICSCGALAETLGDAHRDKMPHGPGWNRLNMVGQVILVFAFALLGLRIAGWAMGEGSAPAIWFKQGLERIPYLNWAWSVDVFLGGVLGIGLYFWFSGRTWCRFFCPLAALMHIYARFMNFRIFPDKKKCISCNVCTSVCHQGIDVMSFANKGAPMADPQCVRCSACVQQCPTGVLSFGRYADGGKRIILDDLPASPVQMREKAQAK
jgi:NosR/NirI family nitrous oxide reductase transcriptional regulator